MDPIQLIECVKKYPVLYDPKTQRTSQRKRAWAEVAEELDEDVTAVYKKWKNIKDEHVKYLKGTSKCIDFPFKSQMMFINSYLPSIATKAHNKQKKNIYHEETDSESDDNENDSQTRASANLKSLDNMNGLDLIFLGVSKLMKIYPQEPAQTMNSSDRVDQACLRVSKAIKAYAQSKPRLVKPKINKFLMEQLANDNNNQSTSKQTQNDVQLRPLTIKLKRFW